MVMTGAFVHSYQNSASKKGLERDNPWTEASQLSKTQMRQRAGMYATFCRMVRFACELRKKPQTIRDYARKPNSLCSKSPRWRTMQGQKLFALKQSRLLFCSAWSELQTLKSQKPFANSHTHTSGYDGRPAGQARTQPISDIFFSRFNPHNSHGIKSCVVEKGFTSERYPHCLHGCNPLRQNCS